MLGVSRQAHDAIERFRARVRIGDADRIALLQQMEAILSPEERDNLRAALERRPVVQAGVLGYPAHEVDRPG